MNAELETKLIDAFLAWHRQRPRTEPVTVALDVELLADVLRYSTRKLKPEEAQLYNLPNPERAAVWEAVEAVVVEEWGQPPFARPWPPANDSDLPAE